MEPASTESPNLQKNRKKQALIAAVSTIALVVGLTEFGLKRRQQRKELNALNDFKYACTFFRLEENLKACKENKDFATVDSHTMYFPSEIALLTQMTHLRISGDGVYGIIPSTLGSLTQLEYLSIFDTQLSGTIPSTLGNLIQLQVLSIFDNHRLPPGTIPPTLGYLTQLSS